MIGAKNSSIQKPDTEDYVTTVMRTYKELMKKNEEMQKRGKKNRASGAAFELRVRKDLEEKGWIVDKWSNNVELDPIQIKRIPDTSYIRVTKYNGTLIPAKHKFRGMGIPMAMGTGFPDFMCHRWNGEERPYDMYEVIGVECKTNGYLDKIEKQKCAWLLENNIFSKILIASKVKENNRIKIVYKEF